MIYSKKISIIVIISVCIIVLCSCSNLLFLNQERIDNTTGEKVDEGTSYKDVKNYAVNNNGVTTMGNGQYCEPSRMKMIPELSEKEGAPLSVKRYYVDNSIEKTDLNYLSNISVEMMDHDYFLEESMSLRDSITFSINSQVENMGKKATVSASGTTTEKGYELFVYIIETTDFEVRMYYVLGDKKLFLVNATAYSDNDSENIFSSALEIVNSFSWE